jgi:hypothetical protein
MSDIRTGSIELEDQDVDLDDLDQAYEMDMDKNAYKTDAPGQQAAPEENPMGGL